MKWEAVCRADDIEPESVVRYDSQGRTFAVFRSPEGEFFATDGLCTHEAIHLAEGFVDEEIIECPKHGGQFNYKTGAARGAPVCVNLNAYPVRLEDGQVLIGIDE